MFNDIKIVGLGGIGSALSNILGRYLNNDPDHEYRVTLIDGDDYEIKNLERQEFDLNIGLNNKAEVKKLELESRFPNLKFNAVPEFIHRENISNIIHEDSTVFICVDNHKSRKIINDHIDSLNNIDVISGGNELIDGNVQIYMRRDGNKLTPSLTDYHPEIENPTDKSPDEMSCEELEESSPQIYFTNLTAAIYMAMAYRNIKEDNLKYSEIYFDINEMRALSKERKLKGSGRTTKTSQTL